MSSAQENALEGGGRGHKRGNIEADLDEEDRNPHRGNILSEAKDPQGDTIQPLSYSCGPKTMKWDNITSYMDELPPLTQHFDLETLCFDVKLDATGEWTEHLSTWREVREQHISVSRLIDSRPTFNRKAAAPPISSLKLRLRAVVTYHELFCKAGRSGAPTDVTMALAEKLVDYLMLCFVRADQATMHERLPQFQTWWVEAVKALQDHHILLEDHVTNSPSVGPETGLAVGPSARTQFQNEWDDVDILRLDTASLGPDVEKWQDIAGNKMAKTELFNAIEIKKYPHIKPNNASNVLLFGPPGTGRTMMVESLAVMSGWTLFQVKSDSFKRKYQGESEKKLGRIYERAKQCKPSIIFFDEVEALMGHRAGTQSEGAADIKTFLLTLLSMVQHTNTTIVTIGNTNRPQDIDSAFLRHFSDRIYVPLPAVGDILKIMLTQIHKYEYDPYLDTSDGRQQLNLLAGKFMRDSRGKRLLSGDDVVQAIKRVLKQKINELLHTKHFEEHTLRDGEKVLRPCAPKEGAIQRSLSELDVVEEASTRLNPLTLKDVATAVSTAVGLTTPMQIMEMEKWDKANGTG